MVCSHSRLFRPDGRRYVSAAHQRRWSVDLAKLRFERRQDQELQRHNKTSEQLRESSKIGSLFATPSSLFARNSFSKQRAFCRPGGYGGAAAPDPIPNSAVKRSSADGTSSQDAGE